MIRVFVFFVLLGLAMAGVVWVAERPGAVTVVWEDWRLDTSLGVLLVAVSIVAVAAALLYRFWRAIWTTPRRMANWRRERRQRLGYAALSSGLVAIAAGDAQGAQKLARRADRLLEQPPLTLLLEAQAAQLAGDEDTAVRHFETMRQHPETEFLGLRGLMARAMRDGHYGRALELAKRAQALRPRAIWVLTALLDLQTRFGDWKGARETLVAAVAAKALPPSQARRREGAVLLELSRAALQDGRPVDALDHARLAYKADPDRPVIAAWLAERYAALGKRRRAAKLVEHEWTRHPHPALLTAYRQTRPVESKLAWVKEAERLAALAPAHEDSHRALGEAAFEAGLWGEARRHYTAAIAAAGHAPPASLCRRMAEVEEADSKDQAAVHRWLTLAAEGHPDAEWICESCGTAHVVWAASCVRCGAFDRMSWRLPDRVEPVVVPALEATAPQAIAPPQIGP